MLDKFRLIGGCGSAAYRTAPRQDGAVRAPALPHPTDCSRDQELHAYHDAATGQHRFAAFRGDEMLGALFVARDPVAVARAWAADQLSERFATPADRLRLLAGRAGGAVKDRGAVICACFEIGINEITEAVTSAKCATVDAIGTTLKAGTNCGSCRAEIGRIVHAARIQKAG